MITKIFTVLVLSFSLNIYAGCADGDCPKECKKCSESMVQCEKEGCDKKNCSEHEKKSKEN